MTFNFPYGAYKLANVTTTIDHARTGESLVAEVEVAMNSSQRDGCSFTIHGSTTLGGGKNNNIGRNRV
jgi:hypothetical protein